MILERTDTVADVEPLVDPGEVAAGSAGNHTIRCEFGCSGDHRHVSTSIRRPTRLLGHAASMTEQAKAGHVGGAGRTDGDWPRQLRRWFGSST